jgi:hypothetical protein
MSTILQAGNATSGALISSDTAGSLQIQTGSSPTTAITVDTSQNVGVGLTSPTSKLTVRTADGDGVSIQNAAGTAYRWAVNADNSFSCVNTGVAERVRIDSSGNVIVGASSTTTGDRIVNTITYDGNNGYSGSRTATVWADSTVRASAQADGGNGQLIFGTETAHNINFITNNVGRMIINSSGDMLLGQASPSAPPTSTADIFYGGLYVNPSRRTTGSSANTFWDSSSGAFFRSTSSLKYKTDINDATYGLADVLKLRPVTYKGKSEEDNGKVFGGFIAEEIDVLGLKEFVEYDSEGNPDSLAYGNMVSLLAKAIQEQQALITQLQADVAALKGAK